MLKLCNLLKFLDWQTCDLSISYGVKVILLSSQECLMFRSIICNLHAFVKSLIFPVVPGSVKWVFTPPHKAITGNESIKSQEGRGGIGVGKGEGWVS